MVALVKWHTETIGMAALYEIPPQLTRSPQNDPAKSPFQVTQNHRGEDGSSLVFCSFFILRRVGRYKA